VHNVCREFIQHTQAPLSSSPEWTGEQGIYNTALVYAVLCRLAHTLAFLVEYTPGEFQLYRSHNCRPNGGLFEPFALAGIWQSSQQINSMSVYTVLALCLPANNSIWHADSPNFHFYPHV